jgi:ribosomal-protein-alanine N-acetyltransferase
MVECLTKPSLSSLQVADLVGTMTLSVRPMELEDIPQASGIEREAFPPPWPATNFRRELTSSSLTHYLVAYEELYESKRTDAEPEGADCNARSSKSKLATLKSSLRRLFRPEADRIALKQRILGFAAVWFMADEAHLANIAVREAYRQRGVGELLLISVIKLAIEHNARFITLEVRFTNKIAQALYKKYGFVEVGTRRAYYTDNREDALLMTADGITLAPFEENFLRLSQAYAQKWGISV